MRNFNLHGVFTPNRRYTRGMNSESSTGPKAQLVDMLPNLYKDFLKIFSFLEIKKENVNFTKNVYKICHSAFSSDKSTPS